MDPGKDPDHDVYFLVSVSFLAITAYNTMELFCWILDYFKRWQGLYFWSISIANLSVGAFMVIATFATAQAIKPLAFGIGTALVDPAILVSTALVLYSRLYLITRGRIVKFVFWLIIISSFFIYIPSVTLLMGAAAGDPRFFGTTLERFNERYTSLGSIGRELLICGIYIYESLRQLKPIMSLKGRAGRKVLCHLIAVNVAVVLLDLIAIFPLCTTKWHIGQWYRGAGIQYGIFAQSVKLKIEFSVLNNLVELLEAPLKNAGLPSTENSQAGRDTCTCLQGEGLTPSHSTGWTR
ncbi:uncharacterized protein DSM5745_01275 [Aspergillus mulundensis]|uniref:DUF7703 domain-containing protein n=1 Tax=Aspergillus mulundensis TaxID=1810919 RepID=A0A3D8T5X8_9EURO|nr:hypothetical protein DSM5745_01275 [Aspergillus mulundensis]RDW93953.1 hypothetical protein DSM5745_01275 [Aspergillus mulundensis]